MTLADSGCPPESVRVSQSHPESARVSQNLPESAMVLDRFWAIDDFLGPLGGP